MNRGFYKTGVVYGLVADDEPLQVRYVGSTLTPKMREAAYRGERAHTSRLNEWIRSVKSRGSTVSFRVLGRYDADFVRVAEYRWWTFWGNYCDLLNACPAGQQWEQKAVRRIMARFRRDMATLKLTGLRSDNVKANRTRVV